MPADHADRNQAEHVDDIQDLPESGAAPAFARVAE